MSNIHNKAVNTLRFLSVDTVEKAKSGHPGMPMGAAPMAYVLWKDFLKFNPQNPAWKDRDRFILSVGHGSALLYSLFHLFGYDLSIEDLKEFRQWRSKTPGHPEVHHTPGVETTTGPLGQGMANAVGMAMAEEMLAQRFNTEDITLVDHYTYVMAGDGDMMEGISSEAMSLAGNLKLGKLIVLYDSNNISIEGSTELTFTEDVEKRMQSYQWQVLKVDDGNNLSQIHKALKEARQETQKPTLIIVTTTIGFGSPNKAGSANVHGSPLGEEEVKITKENLGWYYKEDFYIPQDVKDFLQGIIQEKIEKEESWNEKYTLYKKKHPELAKEWEKFYRDTIDRELLMDEDLYKFSKGSLATRAASGELLNKLAHKIPNLIGGSADLAPSNNTYLNDYGDFSFKNREGRNIRFGVREHAMGGIMNGLYLHGGLRPYGGTFLIFSDYMRPAIRLSALMKVPGIYVFTHDSIALGEDGPTHQPIEQLMSLRLIPNLQVFRPADGKETTVGWLAALSQREKPTALVLTRQNVPILAQSSQEAFKGGYIIQKEKGEKPDIIILASGSEVHLALEAYKKLQSRGIDSRVISLPSWEIFEQQTQDYKNFVLPPDMDKRLAIEAGQSLGWQRYIGDKGKVMGINTFGASAPGDKIMEMYGYHVENVVNMALKLLEE